MELPKMKRQEPRKRIGWRGPLAIISVTIVALSAALVGIAIYTCDTDEIKGTKGLSDSLRTLIDLEKQDRPDGLTPGVPYRQVMRVQGAWNGMTLENADAPPPVVGAGGGMKVAGGRQRGVLVAWIDPREGERAQRAGIRPGDAIVGVDEQKIGGLADMGAASKKVKPGEPLMIHILRQGQLMTTVLPAAAPPLPSLPAALSGPNAYCPHDGVLVPPAQAASGSCPICGGQLYLYNPNPQVPR